MKLDPKDKLIGFTSDFHLEHRNIIKYSNRPFADILEMNEAIRDRHNQIFDRDSIIFNLGDALLVPRLPKGKQTDPVLLERAESLISTFKGTIYYLPGNHESQLDLIKRYWRILPQLYEISVYDEDNESGKQNIVLCHYGMRTWNRAHHGSWHLYGHSHGGLKNDHGQMMQEFPYTLSMDVGVDTNDYHPYTYADIKAHMSTKTFRATDHHSARMDNFESGDLSK